MKGISDKVRDFAFGGDSTGEMDVQVLFANNGNITEYRQSLEEAKTLSGTAGSLLSQYSLSDGTEVLRVLASPQLIRIFYAMPCVYSIVQTCFYSNGIF